MLSNLMLEDTRTVIGDGRYTRMVFKENARPVIGDGRYTRMVLKALFENTRTVM